MARSVGRRSHPAIARQVMRNPKTRAMCLKILEKDIQKDLSQVASTKEGRSCLQQKTLSALQNFSWEKLHEKLKFKAPTLYRVLQGCVNVHRREREGRKGSKTHHPSDSAVLGVCAALLLRHRNQRLNLLQRIISLILHSGHAGKLVRCSLLYVHVHVCIALLLQMWSNVYPVNKTNIFHAGLPTSTEDAPLSLPQSNTNHPRRTGQEF